MEPGHRILIDDGKLALEVTDVTETDVVCTVLEGGVLSNNKGINVPGAAMSVPALSGEGQGGPALGAAAQRWT